VQLAVLTEIDVGNNNIGKEGCRILAEGLKGNKSVQMLNVNDNNVGKEGAAALANILMGVHRCAIKQIRAHGNELGDQGALEFAKVFGGEDCILTYLGIMRNEIGDYGANQLLGNACRSTTLAQLGLMDNRIGDSGAHAAGKLLACSTCALTHLALGRNRISAEGIRSISEGLQNNTTLLSCLMLGNIGVDEVAKLAAENPFDARLDFENNFFKVATQTEGVSRSSTMPTKHESGVAAALDAHRSKSHSGALPRPSSMKSVTMPTLKERAEAADDGGARTDRSDSGTPLSVHGEDTEPEDYQEILPEKTLYEREPPVEKRRNSKKNTKKKKKSNGLADEPGSKIEIAVTTQV
jgi:hypothetical protein